MEPIKRVDIPVLLVHNYYQQPGGEDEAFASDKKLLERFGHTVHTYTVTNDDIKSMGRLSASARTIWNSRTYKLLRDVIQERRPRVVHFHNIFPLVSPAAYYAVHDEQLPVVQTLHNYRLFCLNATFFRDGRPCQDCLGTVPLAGIRHACYRADRLASGVVAGMLTWHRLLGTWSNEVDTYVVLTEDARQRFIRGGLPAERLVIRPNFVDAETAQGAHDGAFALFVGRLSEEKGVNVLLQAWTGMRSSIPLTIVGDGPLSPQARAAAERLPGVRWLGRQTKPEVQALMRTARVLVVPSIWFEGFPMVIVEAYAAGLPIIGSNLGSVSSLVQHRLTGLHVNPGDPADLRAAVEWTWDNASAAVAWGHAARAKYEAEYTGQHSYARLMQVYAQAERLRAAHRA